MSRLPHLRLEGTAESVDYRSTKPPGRKSFHLPVRNPELHAAKLKENLKQAESSANTQRDQDPAASETIVERESTGIVLTFESNEGHGLKVESLESIASGIQLRSVTNVASVEQAKVFVPDGQISYFLKRLEQYATSTILTVDTDRSEKDALDALVNKKHKISVRITKPSGDPLRAQITCPLAEVDRVTNSLPLHCTIIKEVRQNTPLIDSISRIRLAIVQDFWVHHQDSFPGEDEAIWWEVWLDAEREQAPRVHRRFHEMATTLGMRISQRFVTFPERVVFLAYGTPAQFSRSITLISMLAELRRAQELPTAYLDLAPKDQREFAIELRDNIVAPPNDAPAVCILDSGINRNHLLIAPALSEEDTQAVDEEWGTADHDENQHGTGMAGIALYGCLTGAFMETEVVRLRHCLESVKILPPPPQANDPDLYGAVTQQAVALAMIRSAFRNRAICMAVTAHSSDHGLPSSWSGAVDEICAGVLDDTPKLMLISAGNVRHELHSGDYRYHEWNITRAGVEDPAQAWNALTIGAFTEKVVIEDPTYDGYEPLAQAGDLCPTSRTSLAWPEEHYRGWPLKPDIVCEGGNYATRNDSLSAVEDLSLLTTHLHPSGRLVETTRDTSPATALASKMAAELWSHYPKLWPESIRALLVHSANWTSAMTRRFDVSKKNGVHRCLRTYGYGVPDVERATYSLRNSATLLFEGSLQPFQRDKSSGKPSPNEMHLHYLPWPVELLLQLGETPVTMRVTLSYFIEPSPARVGWGENHRYASHGLRFDVKRPLEDLPTFRKRISSNEWDIPRDTSSRPQSQKDTRKWSLGVFNRTHGSLHSDWWRGTAAELAACGQLAVYPVTGWWRERAHLERVESVARYSLVISLETPKADADLYTPIENSGKVVTEVLT